jgi:hypothetical protein
MGVGDAVKVKILFVGEEDHSHGLTLQLVEQDLAPLQPFLLRTLINQLLLDPRT